MIKTKEEIEKEFYEEFTQKGVFDDNRIILNTENPEKILNFITQLEENNLNTIKEMINGLEYGGYALSSNDSRRGSDEMRTDILQELDNLNKETNYERDYSHSHCFNNKNSACGDSSDKHLHCCICGVKNNELKGNSIDILEKLEEIEEKAKERGIKREDIFNLNKE